MATLKLAPVTRSAAKYAVEHWHYSRTMPASKLVPVGVWEDDQFIGTVVFGRGANRHIADPLGLDQTEVCELVRVALRDHQSPVSQIIKEAIALLRISSPGLRVVMSYADMRMGHYGFIYQASNWLYLGMTPKGRAWVHPATGKLLHSRVTSGSGWNKVFDKRVPVFKRSQLREVELPPKHRYALPLDKAIRRQIARRALPYPKPESGSQGSNLAPSTGGAVAPSEP